MKYSKKIFIIIFLFVVAATALFAFGGEIFAQQTYTPLSPLPGDGGSIDITDPSSYFARMFAIFVGLAAVIAVIMLVICGFQYMTSDAISSKESAKKRCWAAILGLGLILISWIILNTINPNLLNLPFASLQDTLKQGVVNPETGASTGGSTIPGPQPPLPPTINSFTASPNYTVEGNTLNLSWNADADTCSGNLWNTQGDVAGSQTITPLLGFNTYTITCARDGKTVLSSQDVIVVQKEFIDETGKLRVLETKTGSTFTCSERDGYINEGAQNATVCNAGDPYEVGYVCCVYEPTDNTINDALDDPNINYCFKIASWTIFGVVIAEQNQCGDTGWTQTGCEEAVKEAEAQGETVTQSCQNFPV